jgi:hypothetical protein
MAVETLGEAWRLGWKLTARCAFGNRDGMKSIRECIYRSPLDMQTLVWTRGPNFPLSRLESRLMCPECGSRRVSVLFDVPKVPVAARAKRATERYLGVPESLARAHLVAKPSSACRTTPARAERL